MPRVRAEVIEQGGVVSRKRVACLMRDHGLRGISRRARNFYGSVPGTDMGQPVSR